MNQKPLSAWAAGAYAVALVVIALLPCVIFILTGGKGIN